MWETASGVRIPPSPPFVLLNYPVLISRSFKELNVENPFCANWTSKGNTLCLGHWQIAYKGMPLILPQVQMEKDMGTKGIYNFIDPDDELYLEGLGEDEWIIENIEWLTDVFLQANIPLEEENFRAFYQAVNKEDWRCGSCGGCI